MAIITISRQFGSLGTEIANTLQEELKYRYLDKTVLEEILVRKYGIPEENVERYDEKKPPLWDIFSSDKDKYLHFMKTALYEFARKGNCIIVGQGGQVLLHDVPGTLHVRVLAPNKARIERIQQRYGYNERLAEQAIRHSDHDRIGFHKFFFHANWDDVNLYDLLLNTRLFSIEQGVGLLKESIATLNLDEQHEQSLHTLKDYCLGQEVISQIAYTEKIPIQFLETYVVQGVVTLRGSTITSDDIARCETIARQVPGVKDVVNEVYFIPSTYGMT